MTKIYSWRLDFFGLMSDHNLNLLTKKQLVASIGAHNHFRIVLKKLITLYFMTKIYSWGLAIIRVKYGLFFIFKPFITEK